ncbi:hypothetical protein [Nesterenkonia alba]|uniref:hypothetical protein n=1 Tax=Nesterenkonia alba TaxID=515814 RepID=UPI0003B33562|nr:hypothetical protein [Nesterenkonia alba]
MGEMPWYGWIVIAAILVFGLTQVISMISGRPIPNTTGAADPAEIEELKERIAELERTISAGELEEPTVPTKAEENLAADNRWRLDMLEARLEQLEKRPADPDTTA